MVIDGNLSFRCSSDGQRFEAPRGVLLGPTLPLKWKHMAVELYIDCIRVPSEGQRTHYAL